MEQSTKILGLYDTILGHFKFFRKFIEILIGMEKSIKELETECYDIYSLINDLTTQIKDLKDKVTELQENMESIPKSDREVMPRKTRDIMDTIYNSYNRDDN